MLTKTRVVVVLRKNIKTDDHYAFCFMAHIFFICFSFTILRITIILHAFALSTITLSQHIKPGISIAALLSPSKIIFM